MAIAAVSLGALTALGACGDDVTVTPAPDAPVVISITPQNATLNIGESTTLAVQITGGSSTTPPTLASCTSSNTAVATASIQGSACKVTAVTAGNVSVTAAASTGGVAASQITVNPAPAAISNLTTSPTSASIAVGQKLTVVPNVTKGGAAVAVTYGYSSSASSIASVNATTGEVTAVAPGTATITVSASGAATGFTTTALTAGVTITVTPAPNALTSLTVQPTSLNMALGSTAQLNTSVVAAAGVTPAISYTSQTTSIATVSGAGLVTAVAPGTTTIKVTAVGAGTATLTGNTLEQLVSVTVNPAANVTIQTITQGPTVSSVRSSTTTAANDGIIFSANGQVDQPVDIANTRDQIQVKLNLQPNGQRVDSVVVFIADADGSNRRAAARQIYSNGTANAGDIGLFVNTADFDVNVNQQAATTYYKNGQKIISASVFTTSSTGVASELQNASNNRQTLNFNNIDGWAVKYVVPTRSAQTTNTGVAQNWWGGPGAAGGGSWQLYAVYYTPNRSSQQFTTWYGEGLGNPDGSSSTNWVCGSKDFAAPFTTGAVTTYGKSSFDINCDGYNHNTSIANPTSNFPVVTFQRDNYNNPAPTVAFFGGYRTNAQVPAISPIRGDWRNPNISFSWTPQISGAEQLWANAAFNFFTVTQESDDAVGLPSPLGQTLTYTGCQTGGGGTNVAMPTGTGADIPECSNDFLGGATGNGPYFITATQADVLTNTAVVPSGSQGVVGSGKFGVDKTQPAIQFTDENTLAGVSSALSSRQGLVIRTNADSIFDNATTTFTSGAGILNAATAVNSTNAHFGARYRDERSGFAQLNHGTRSLTRWAPAASPLLTNVSVASEQVASGTRTLNFDTNLGNQESIVDAGDPTYRRDSLPIFGNNGGTATSPGYYFYRITVVDRAGNSRSANRSAAIDITSPQVTGVTIPAVLQGGAQLTFNPTGVDDLEALDGDLYLNYPTMATAGDGAADLTVIANQNGRLRFRRNWFTDWHAAWAGGSRNTVVTNSDGLLSTPFGPGAALSNGGLQLPIGFYQRVEVVQAAAAKQDQGPHGRPAITRNAPTEPNLVAIPVHATWTSLNSFKPTQLGVYAFDLRAVTLNSSTAVNFPDNGMSNVAGTEAAYQENLFAANITQPTQVNYWGTKDLDATSAGNQYLWSWYCYTFASSTLECRAETGTNVVNSPFTRVDYYRWKVTANANLVGGPETLANRGQWIYIGSVTANTPTNPIQQDQGVTRLWRFTFSFAGFGTSGNNNFNTEAALANNDLVRAIGVDANGNAISTLTFTLAVAP